MLIHDVQGKGKSPREVLKRIDYGGIATTLAWVRINLSVFCSTSLQLPQVFAALLFLSYRYNEQLPVGKGCPPSMIFLKHWVVE